MKMTAFDIKVCKYVKEQKVSLKDVKKEYLFFDWEILKMHTEGDKNITLQLKKSCVWTRTKNGIRAALLDYTGDFLVIDGGFNLNFNNQTRGTLIKRKKE